MMQINIISTPIDGLLLFKPAVFTDKRGYFAETYNHNDLSAVGINHQFVQDNQSMSHQGALRGLHFQKPPYAQAKLVRVIMGAVFDVVVDIRKGSKTYGQYFGAELSSENFLQLYVPEGFAHGFVTLVDNTIFSYKCSTLYNKESEGGLMWNEPAFNIPWGVTDPQLSEKDTNFISFKEFDSPF